MVFLIISISVYSQFKSIAICKGDKTKLIYKQGHSITVSTKQNKTISGLIFLIDEDSIYFNNSKAVALEQISLVHPIYKPKFSFYKPENLKGWFDIVLISFALLTFGDPTNIFDLWISSDEQQAQLSRKQRRLNKKYWQIGSTYKLCLK